jgi:hypothetical protein
MYLGFGGWGVEGAGLRVVGGARRRCLGLGFGWWSGDLTGVRNDGGVRGRAGGGGGPAEEVVRAGGAARRSGSAAGRGWRGPAVRPAAEAGASVRKNVQGRRRSIQG